MFALLTYLLLTGGTARLAARLVSEDDALTRDTATVLWTWQVLTLAVAVLPSLPVLNELLFSCALVLAVGDPVHVDAVVRIRLIPSLADSVVRVLTSSRRDVAPRDAHQVTHDVSDVASDDAATEDPM